MNAVERNILFTPVRTDPACQFWAEVAQSTNRRPCAAAGTQLQNLAEETKCGDRGGRFEISLRSAAHSAKRGGEYPGKDGRNDAIDIGDSRAHRDQREHVH